MIRGSGAQNHPSDLDDQNTELDVAVRWTDRSPSRFHRPRNTVPVDRRFLSGGLRRWILIDAAFGEDRPGDARHLIGQRDSDLPR